MEDIQNHISSQERLTLFGVTCVTNDANTLPGAKSIPTQVGLFLSPKHDALHMHVSRQRRREQPVRSGSQSH